MNIALTINLALRNILRNRRRSLLTLLGTSVAVLVLVTAYGMIGGIETSSVKSYVETRTAHLKVFSTGYPYRDENLPLDQPLSPGQQAELSRVLHGMPGLHAAPRLLFPASLISEGTEILAVGAGVDPVADPLVLAAPGPAAAKLTSPRAVLVGSDLAALLHLKPGDMVTASFRTKYGTIFADDFTVAGLVDSGNPEVDGNYFFLALPAAQSYLEMPGEATEWDLRLEHPATLPMVEKRLAEALGKEFQVVSWTELLSDIMAFFDLRRKVFYLVTGFLFAMAVILVANTMLMAVYERFKEVGVLMALGMRRRQIISLFAAEGALLGIFGGLVGIAIGAILVGYLSHHGIDLSGASRASLNVPLKGKVYADLAPSFYPLAVALAGFVAGLAALWPALRAASLDPAATLRNN